MFEGPAAGQVGRAGDFFVAWCQHLCAEKTLAATWSEVPELLKPGGVDVHQQNKCLQGVRQKGQRPRRPGQGC